MSTPASIRDSFIHHASKGEWFKILFGIFFPTWGGGGGGGGGGGEGGGHQSPNFMFTKYIPNCYNMLNSFMTSSVKTRR